MIKSILMAVACIIISFIAVSFYCWSLDPAEWGDTVRFVALMLMGMSSGVAICISRGIQP